MKKVLEAFKSDHPELVSCKVKGHFVSKDDWRKYMKIHMATGHPERDPDGTTYIIIVILVSKGLFSIKLTDV